MRRSFQVVTAALLVGASPAAADREVLREQSEQTVEARGFKTLEVINARGRVDLLPSPDAKLHLTALKIVRYRSHERAQELARGIVVETGVRDDRYVVEVRYQKRHSVRISFWDIFKIDGLNLPAYEVRVTCQVPRGLPVTVRESSGDIRSEGLAGAQVLRTSSGDIVVESAGGPLEALSSSGEVTATAVRQARVKSVSGDVVVRQVEGPLHASTSSGSITVTGAVDSLALSSVSGDISADHAPRGLDAETSSGEIRLQLAAAVACALDMRTSSGTIEVEQPMQMKSVSRRSVSGVIRGGRTPVVLHTASGDITVVGGGE